MSVVEHILKDLGESTWQSLTYIGSPSSAVYGRIFNVLVLLFGVWLIWSHESFFGTSDGYNRNAGEGTGLWFPHIRPFDIKPQFETTKLMPAPNASKKKKQPVAN